MPKRLGQSNLETVARLVAKPIKFLAIATKPFVRLLSGSTRGLLRLMGVKESTGSSAIEAEIHAEFPEGTSAGVIESHELDGRQTAGFFGSRWRGEADLSQLYWRDILLVGSIINLVTGFFALMIAAQDGDLWVAAMVHFACLPYNVFLVLVLWRTPGCSKVMAWTSLVWLGAVMVL